MTGGKQFLPFLLLPPLYRLVARSRIVLFGSAGGEASSLGPSVKVPAGNRNGAGARLFPGIGFISDVDIAGEIMNSADSSNGKTIGVFGCTPKCGEILICLSLEPHLQDQPGDDPCIQ